MVQRKAPTKPGLQADHHHQTENQFHHHDVKDNKGADLKKKMKKSGSVKRPKLPGKSPPPGQSPAGKTATTPNYMKPTTSSDARKEQSQPQVSPHSSSLRRKSSDNSKICTPSCKKGGKTLLARALTKNPSFKPARRKCTTVVLSEDLDAGRATCSSTLKDCKFPPYLSLNPGGTESDGTSTIKVCPYTYCSLNGHHHAPLPPLKCFLSARRCVIKAQRSFKLGCLSPRRVKPVADGGLIEEENKEFFIEIYSKKDEDTGLIIDDERAAEDQEEGVLEAVSGAPICDDFDTYDALDRNRDVETMDEADTYLLEQDQEIEVGKEISPPVLVEEDQNPDFSTELPNLYEVEGSEGSDMEWEKGYLYDYEYECSPATDIEPDPETGAGENPTIKDEFILESDSKDWCFDDFLADQECQEYYEESLNSDAFSSNDDGEYSDSNSHLDSSSTMKPSAPAEVEEEEEEPVHDEENHIMFESSCDNLNHQSPVKENSIAVTEKEPHSEGAPVKPTKAECCITGKVETDDSRLARFTAKSKKPVQDSDELGSFNPREPNFLPLDSGPEAEKVDLKHQDLDERKNAEEWMVDYALRQVVTKLGPARKRKVALLVEAFEKVMPITKCDLHLRHGARPIQACN